jgi:hypothetical protein
MVANKKFALEKAAQNLLTLIEIRDNAAHLINKDLYISRRVQEIGTSLRNYLLLASAWFKLDLSQYNFFLMPISFFHGFEAAEPATRAEYSRTTQTRLLVNALRSDSKPSSSEAKTRLRSNSDTRKTKCPRNCDSRRRRHEELSDDLHKSAEGLG